MGVRGGRRVDGSLPFAVRGAPTRRVPQRPAGATATLYIKPRTRSLRAVGAGSPVPTTRPVGAGARSPPSDAPGLTMRCAVSPCALARALVLAGLWLAAAGRPLSSDAGPHVHYGWGEPVRLRHLYTAGPHGLSSCFLRIRNEGAVDCARGRSAHSECRALGSPYPPGAPVPLPFPLCPSPSTSLHPPQGTLKISARLCVRRSLPLRFQLPTWRAKGDHSLDRRSTHESDSGSVPADPFLLHLSPPHHLRENLGVLGGDPGDDGDARGSWVGPRA